MHKTLKSLPCGYHALVAPHAQGRPDVQAFLDWLRDEAQATNARPEAAGGVAEAAMAGQRPRSGHMAVPASTRAARARRGR